MNRNDSFRHSPFPRLVYRILPGLAQLVRYRQNDLPHDCIAGLSVAAVALPVGVAYAQLAGFSPAVGLYSSILPLLAYALVGTSPRLIVGPDAATCALVTAAVTSLASGDPVSAFGKRSISIYPTISEGLEAYRKTHGMTEPLRMANQE